MQVGELSARLSLNIQEFRRNIREAQQQFQGAADRMQNIGGRMQNVGKDMALKVSAPIAAIGAISIKTAAEFEAGMNKVKAISGATGKDFESLKTLARELGSTTQFSASEAAEGMSFLAMAGFKTSQIISAMPGLLNLAAAGAMELGDAADITSNIMSGFGLKANEAAHVADVLAKASSTANVDVKMMGESMKYAAPIAKQFGVSVEEAAALTAKMGDAGIQGSQAGTALRAAFARLAAAPKPVADALNKYDIAIENSSGKMRNIYAVMGDMEVAMQEMTESEKIAFASHVFGQEAMSGWLKVLDDGSTSLKDYTNELENADGTAKSMAETINEGLSGELKKMRSALEDTAITVGNVLIPILVPLVKKIQDLAAWFGDLNPVTRKIILTITGLVTILGPVIMGIGGIISAVGTILPLFGSLAGAAGVVSIAIQALAGPIGIAIAVIAALIAIGVAIYKNWDTIVAKGEELWRKLSDAFRKIKDGITNDLIKLKDNTVRVLTGIWDYLKSIPSQAITWGKNIVQGLWNGIKNFGSWLYNRVKSFITDNLTGAIKKFLGIASPSQVMAELGVNTVEGLNKGMQERRKNLIATMEAISGDIKGGLADLPNEVEKIGQKIGDGITNPISAATKKAKDTMDNWHDTIQQRADSGYYGERLYPEDKDDSWDKNLDKDTQQRIIDNTSYTGDKTQDDVKEENWKWEELVGGWVNQDTNQVSWVKPFAEGGIVTKPTLGLVGEAGPEAVVPLDKANMGQGQVIVQNMYVRDEYDIQKIARELFTLSKNKARGLGV